MGIFDDAIREHLELKRQHGAGEGELEQLESEAFGPATRPGDPGAETALAEPPEPAGGDLAAEAPTTIAEPAPLPGEADEPLPEPHVEAEEPTPEPAEPVALETEEHPPPEPPEEPEPVASVDQPTELYEVEEGEEEAAAEPSAEEHVVPPQPGEPPLEEGADVEDEFFSEQSLSDELDQALDAPDVAAEPEPEAVEDEGGSAEDGEDVLEETPEFLQDQPEGENLWFEQKPPKDFDFDD
jgi:hypothetical protein